MSEGDETQIDINVKSITNLIEKAIWYISAREVLIIGQERAGKTRLFEYILGEGTLFREEEDSPVTVDPDVKWFRSVKIKSGGGTREIRIRRASDQSGQSGPFIHAKLIEKYKPNLVFIVLDLTSPIAGKRSSSGGTWFKHFAKKLKEILSESRRTRKALNCICVLLNKEDKLNERNRSKVIKKYELLVKEQVEKYIKIGTKPVVVVKATSVVELDDIEAVRKNLNQIIYVAAKHGEG